MYCVPCLCATVLFMATLAGIINPPLFPSAAEAAVDETRFLSFFRSNVYVCAHSARAASAPRPSGKRAHVGAIVLLCIRVANLALWEINYDGKRSLGKSFRQLIYWKKCFRLRFRVLSGAFFVLLFALTPRLPTHKYLREFYCW
jgi:hypothetical protein